MLMSTSPLPRSRAGLALVAIVALLTAGACGGGAPQPTGSPPTVGSTALPTSAELTQQLADEVGVDGALTHLTALEKTADENGGNRAAGTPGYAASVDYVVGVLRGAGFDAASATFEVSGDDEEVKAGTGRNVLAQTRTGDPGRVVMLGAHLDSVPEGPGVVDNGSGVAALLEIATRLGSEPAVQNAVRFAFFDHEESGALGSTSYVESLPTADRKKIKLYLNADMVASPNGGYTVQGGKGTDPETAGPPGSAAVGRLLSDQLVKAGVKNPAIIEFVGDDESPFIEEGIPVGGAENGDAGRKTTEQAAAWGGQAGQVYDRCYHQACDRLDNVNREVLERYLRALAGSVGYLATSTEELR